MKYWIYKYTVKDVERFNIIAEGDGVRLSIPPAEDNTDYQNYLEWVAAGNTPEPWNPEQENN